MEKRSKGYMDLLSRHLHILFSIALAIYAFSWHPLPPAYHGAEGALVALFLLSLCLRQGRPLRTNPAFLLCMALLVYLAASLFYHRAVLPEAYDVSVRFSRYYLKPLLILIVAYGLALARPGFAWLFLPIAFCGLLVQLALTVNGPLIDQILQGYRPSFGFTNAQHSGVAFGTALLALVIFAPRVLHTQKPQRYAYVVLLACAIVISAACVLVTQVRAVWLGLALALPIGFVLSLVYRDRSRKPSLKGVYLPIAALLAVIGVTTALLLTTGIEGHMEKRLSATDNQIEALQQAFALEDVKNTSTAVRVASWSAAIDWFSQRPILGWGPGTTPQLIENAPYFDDWFKNQFGHLHNSYLEAAVSLGTLGLLLLLGLVAYLGWATIQAYRSGAMPRDAFIFAWTFFIFWMVVNCFESYIMFNSGHVITACVGGFIYHFYLKTGVKDHAHKPGTRATG
ncbi:O-antigen ligase family protein [Marinobacter fonticola]|uniref:O-antigen ligase family protein n=1 Tax=Marinobacter fonticola TaxID=2603215 RepID=UPI00143CD1E1|nr:O-antigen ligase family protein [Marinobacter fonticola]